MIKSHGDIRHSHRRTEADAMVEEVMNIWGDPTGTLSSGEASHRNGVGV